MNDQVSPAVLAALRDVLDKQMEANDPPETAATLDRLLRSGIDEDVAWRLLSAVLLQEMSLILRTGRTFDRDGYVEALHRLPDVVDR